MRSLLAQFMGTYGTERETAFKARLQAEQKVRVMQPKIREYELKVEKFSARQQHERAVAAREQKQRQADELKAKAKEDRRKRLEDEKRERRRKELLDSWPKYVYNVYITLDATPTSPISSRRNSTISDFEPVKATSSKSEGDNESAIYCDLVLSYVTTSAFWAPSYDMQLSTTNNTGTLLFDAQLHNSTSETWKDCRITLSTSQATATSIDEPIPALVPWHIRLLGKGETAQKGDDISRSKAERDQKLKLQGDKNPATLNKNRSEMFQGDDTSNLATQDYQMQLMLLEQQNKKRLQMAREQQDSMGIQPGAVSQLQLQQQQQARQQQILQQQMAQQQMVQQQAQTIASYQQVQAQNRQAMAQVPQGYAPFAPGDGSAGAVVGSSVLSKKKAKPQSSGPTNSFGSKAQSMDFFSSDQVSRDVLNEFDFDSFLSAGADDKTLQETPPSLGFVDSLIEETGLTTAYDLPGTKTLVPSAGSSKHRVARLSLTNVMYNYTIVPKYKAVAYLKAKIRNSSKLTLLRGDLGLTLDGSFLGRTSLPRCSAGETLTLGMGIDPSLKVQYPGPDVRRATTGLFSKEDSSVYNRTITLENTRSSAGSKPITIYVHDQVPVSEDERLKVEILEPRGLLVNGGGVKAGIAAIEGVESRGWGEATAIRKETGAVSWSVKLNPGKAVKLVLEYVVAMPSGVGHSAVSLK